MENLGFKVDIHQKTCFGNVKRAQAPSCAHIGRMLQRNNASKCTRTGCWFISILQRGQLTRGVYTMGH